MMMRLFRAPLQLGDEDAAVVDGALGQDPDRGHVGERRRHLEVGLRHGARVAAEQVHRADDLVPQPQRQGVHRVEVLLVGGQDEPRPAVLVVGQVRHGHRVPAGDTVHAGALVGLLLEQLQQPGVLGGGGHDLQAAALVGQQDARRVGAQQVHALVHQFLQEVCHVVVGDQGVRQTDEPRDEGLFTIARAHHASPLLCTVSRAGTSVPS
jgi:hypothetical protein